MLILDAMIAIRTSPIALVRWSEMPHAERAIARGEVVRVRRGVFALASEWSALAHWDRYLARVHAVALIHPDAVFCLESAAVLLGLPVMGDPVTVHVLLPPTGTSRQLAGVRTHRSAPERTIVRDAGINLTAPIDTAVDIARHRHNAFGLAVADAALRVDPVLDRDDLIRLNERRLSSRGRNIARWPLARATALAETALESVSRACVEWLGFPMPELQVTFRTHGVEDRCDFLWRTYALCGEADGDLKYDGRFGDPRAILHLQSERDSRLRTRFRAVAHWGWREATDVAPLRGILTGVGLPQVAPEDTAQLVSLRRALTPRTSSAAPHR
ncbi:type IV toxin-antitoxin system AbiEi family antitoxin domain-containing protein [Microbacterium luticocti]|uniref:type IV toxin-antitoxin system AbiEi family antitoxin domain-containing protein n=1 Tax=Microbacterium luticocti TaxID=451764 RepID=UPI00055FF2A1|nr:hypothetical protein [Microbacterium luticocti]